MKKKDLILKLANKTLFDKKIDYYWIILNIILINN